MINVPDTREQIPVTVSQIMSLLYFENVNLHSKFPQGGCSKLGLFHVAQAKAGNQLSKMRGEGGREMEGRDGGIDGERRREKGEREEKDV